MFTIATLGALAGVAWAFLLVRALLDGDLKKSSNSLVWVAECWLEWPVCRGSTLYRRSFKSARAAERSARRRAWLLDMLLPSHYRAEYSSGRPYMESYDFGIKWGVRMATSEESAKGVDRIWAPTLPGSNDFSGEHALGHPMQSQSDAAVSVACTAQGYRV